MSLCKYKTVLGTPGKGVHTHFMGIAYKDVIGTILIALILYMFFPRIPLVYYMIGIFGLGILLHRLFCVNTTVDKLLFGYR